MYGLGRVCRVQSNVQVVPSKGESSCPLRVRMDGGRGPVCVCIDQGRV
jgi:hypothetical protein